MKIITVTGYKGGIAKSTTAIHLATFFSEFGQTLLVDGDLNRTSLAWAERGQFPFEVVNQHKAMKAISGKEYVIIDTPARPDSDELAELADGCDLLILPTTPDVVSLQPMMQTARDLGDDVFYRVLITIVPPYPNKEGQMMKQELQKANLPVFNTLIRRTTGYQQAAMKGVPIRDLKTGDLRKAWQDYKNLGKEIQELWQ
ncbi:MAG: ParA family protein [Xenococcus sp. MO_188.B8]|nr:ParA family protein [Xenococcus sp. MO_188.B8]